MMRTFGTMLYAERMARGLTLQELGKVLGITAAMVGKLENDRRKPSQQLVTTLILNSKIYNEAQWNKAAARSHGWKV